MSKEIMFDYLCDAGKILADLQYNLSMTRRAFIIPALDPLIKTVSEEAAVDTFLFGQSFSERIKTAREVHKAVKDLEKNSSNSSGKRTYGSYNKDNSRQSQSSRTHLNSKGPLKYSTSSKKGGKSLNISSIRHISRISTRKNSSRNKGKRFSRSFKIF